MKRPEEGKRGEKLKRRLKGVRKRRKTEQGFGSEVIAFKMRLVEARKRERRRGR